MANAALEEAIWLKDNPEFRMRPANIREFCGPGYLNERNVRPGIMQALVETFGEEVNAYSISNKRRALLTGAIGIGKSTYAAIALSYMVHWIKCLKNPKEFYNLSEDSVIGFMMMSTTEKLAQEVIFQKVKKRIQNSKWFQLYAPLAEENKRMQKQMRFEGDIWIVPGSSAETSFEGYDILGGIVDEGDSHQVTDQKDYAEAGYNTIESRIESRFTDFMTGQHRGLMICIGQAKRKNGFMLRHYDEFSKDPDSVAVRMTIWESFGWHNYTFDKNDIKLGRETAERDSFYYDMRKRELYSKEAAQLIMNKDLIEVPTQYRKSFERDPVKALRDLAGIPPEVDDPFISRPDFILDNQELWHQRYPEYDSPVGPEYRLDRIVLPDWFVPGNLGGDYRRVIHIDTAYSPDGDALGFAMAHVPEKVNEYEEERPVIVFDLLLRIKATPSVEINFGEIRKFIYQLRDERGFEIDLVTIDGFNSFDFIQQLRRNKVKSDYLSVDKTKAPYEDLREVINDRRCYLPKYMVPYHRGDTKLINIAYKELSEVQDVGRKIDHPKDGSKDVADAITGCVHTLVSISKFTREARTIEREGVRAPGAPKKAEVLSDASDFFGAPKAMQASLDAHSPISFEEFARAQNDLLAGGVNFSTLLNGLGPAGYEDRIL
ncbi:terminase [Gordonia phage Woes]|uniref:Terminase n=5 Tax=Woesvirus woes TaxID=1982751 RepID=A0A482JGS5_9CAUD|nr:terminase [Gordonia phage Woes]ATW61104.1 terminase [Gordonia phage Anamika]AVP43193.1 terminase [Gordonia phage Hail2Pitt]QBP30582.1 terminase [Gordonia phage Lahirium]QBP31785.1 terminase [Gordonia phage Nimi13]ANA85781.1 terminase [Gordonia phage Woes]